MIVSHIWNDTTTTDTRYSTSNTNSTTTFPGPNTWTVNNVPITPEEPKAVPKNDAGPRVWRRFSPFRKPYFEAFSAPWRPRQQRARDGI